MNDLTAIPADLEVIVPAQWPLGARDLHRRGASWSRLGAAVLREAWDTLRAPVASRVHREAVAFFLEPDDRAPVSLERACAWAGVEPDAVRRAVRAHLWKSA